MSPRTGRPISEDGKKDKLLQIRLDERTFNVLDECAKKAGISRSDVVRKGIDLFSEKVNKK